MATATLDGAGQLVSIDFLDCCPEPVGAWDRDHAAFTHVAVAYEFGRRDHHGRWRAAEECAPRREHASDEDRAVLRANFPMLKRAFEREHGAICRSYFGRHVFAAAVLTKSDEISVVIGDGIPTRCSPSVDLLRRCQQVGYMAWHRLAQYDRRLCQNMVFSVIEELLRRLDESPPEDAVDEAHDDLLRKQLDEAETFMLRCAARRAQIRYLKGMLAGTLIIASVLGLAAATAVSTSQLSAIAGELLIVATAGSVGAFVSVLARMTSGTFRMNLPTLSFEMRSTDLWLMGGLRPLIGLIFALAAYVLVVSALIPMQSRGVDTQIFLYAAVGFLAGFSERFAQDVFVRSGQGLAGVMGDSPTSGPSAGLSPPPGA